LNNNFLLSELIMMDNVLLKKIIKRLKIEPGLILLHHNADIDAVGSAIALHNAYPKFSIGAFDNISQVSRRFLSRFQNIDILTGPDLEKFKTIVILDTSTPSQLGIPSQKLHDYIIIDHHVSTSNWDTELYYCDETKTSCAEIIFELLEILDFSITTEVALALSTAILADSGHFKFASKDTLITFARLLELGNIDPGDVFEVLENNEKIDSSQKIAHLKGAQRLKFEQLYGFLVASSTLSSYEASMCKNLISLGADIAFVGAQRENQVRISGRATRDVVKHGIHLGEFFSDLGSELACEGGGHDGAGGLNGIGDVEMILSACMGKISQVLKKI
jgi:phosphoesterase RecJ-like protein